MTFANDDTVAKITQKVIGRDSERSDILDFVDKCDSARLGRTMYVCGSPGVGKTVCVQNVLDSWMRETDERTQTVRKYDYRNVIGLHDHLKVFVALENLIKGTSCVSHIRKKRPRGLEDDIGESFAQVADCVDSVVDVVRNYCVKPTTCVFVLDEIDYLCPSLSGVTRGGASKASLAAKRQLELIKSLFSLPRKLEGSKCCLILIGIANSIDLSAKLTARSRDMLIDSTLIFRPYTAGELASIVGEVSEHKLDRISVEICSRKVAALHGDCRKVIDLCKQAKSNQIKSGSESAGVKDLMAVMEKAYRSQSESSVTLKALPIQQLLVLVAACRYATRNNERTDFFIPELKKELCCLAKEQNIPSDFVGPMASLVERVHALAQSGLMALKAATRSRPAVWRLNSPPDQLENTLRETNQVVASALAARE